MKKAAHAPQINRLLRILVPLKYSLQIVPFSAKQSILIVLEFRRPLLTVPHLRHHILIELRLVADQENTSFILFKRTL